MRKYLSNLFVRFGGGRTIWTILLIFKSNVFLQNEIYPPENVLFYCNWNSNPFFNEFKKTLFNQKM